MGNELIKLKGTGDGVKIYLDAESPISEITSSLYEKLRQFRKFFGDGHCNIYFAGRELNASDKMRLEAIVTAMLPESTVNYGDRKKMNDDEGMEKTLELPADMRDEESGQEERFDDLEEMKRVFASNFKSSRARFYEGNIHEGKTLESDGHLILVGNVDKGGKLIAAGNIIVLGTLSGSAHAGCRGSDGAYVIALDMRPEDIRISKERARFEKSDFRGGTKKAYLSDGRILPEKFPDEDI